MARPSQQLHPLRAPAQPRPAATVLLLRDTDQGPEVLMTRRSLTASFAPGAYVFPGGALDAADAQTHGLCQRRPTQGDGALTQAVAAIRESFEELGVLLARRADGDWVTAEDMRGLDRSSPLPDQCATRGWTLAADAVYLLAHWTTDRDLPKRFDVPFLAARMPGDQTPVADGSEQFEPVWVRPADALARHAAGDFLIIFPTIRTLERLQTYPTVDAILAACAGEQPLWTSCPRAGWLNGQEARYMEHEPPFGELELVCPDGQLLHHLDWRTDQPVGLLRNVQRLTAPNPGMMTGPGTNTYIVGDPDTGYLVVDPGPDDAEHIERIWRATGGQVHHIVCTHSHPDHAPGAARLQQRCATRPPIRGLASGPQARSDSRFAPDQTLAHGERLVLGHTHTLHVLHTPGHAANHLCLVLEEDGLLFSGDHILNGSTTVVAPPDGHMDDYLRSLDLLAQACTQHGVTHILPAHGYVLGQASQAIAQLKAHRLAREAKVAQAMQERPDGTLTDWLPLVYGDVPERLWPVARGSLQAHVDRIRSLGLFNA